MSEISAEEPFDNGQLINESQDQQSQFMSQDGVMPSENIEVDQINPEGSEEGEEIVYVDEDGNVIDQADLENYQQGGGEDDGYEEDGYESPKSPDSPVQLAKEPTKEERITYDIRYHILDECNSFRESNKLQRYWEDVYMTKPAREYANYLLPDEGYKIETDEGLLTGYIHGDFGAEKKFEYIWLRYVFEDDMVKDMEGMLNVADEVCSMLKECDSERAKLMNPEYNTISVGIAYSQRQMIIVCLLTQNLAGFTAIRTTDNGIDVEGEICQADWGVIAAKLVYQDQNVIDHENDNVAIQIGPRQVDSNTQEGTFVCHFDIAELINDPPKKVVIYLFKGLTHIEYLKKTNSKRKNKNYNIFISMPCVEYPIEQLSGEEASRKALAEKRRLMKMREEEERKQQEEEKARQRMELRGQMNQNESENEEDEPSKSEQSAEEDEASEDASDSMEGDYLGTQMASNQPKQISNKMIRMELEKAIEEATNECNKLEQENLLLQAEIVSLKKESKMMNEKTTEFNMSDVKYANTLARVHQIRLELKQTQERYSKMTNDLKIKLNEKIEKCNEIKATFMELKREVSRKAAFSKTDKPIPEKDITEWEELEYSKSKELQKLRLDILKLRANLNKHEKELKKREELAEGLHLIDFEQLKIENQSLNEKIEERNEDLHKLRKKNTTTVQILTHTIEKYEHILKENNDLSKKLETKQSMLTAKKGELAEAKTAYEDSKKLWVSLTQTTGIVNNQELKNDFEIRQDRNKGLKVKLQDKKKQYETMMQVITRFEQLNGYDKINY